MRTITGTDGKADRASIRRLAKIDPDNAAVAAWKARKRTRDAQPKQIGKALDDGATLLKKANGLGA